METGGDPDRFWGLTPKEIQNEIAARVVIHTRQQRERAWHAWHSGVLSQMTKPPDLYDFMGIERAPLSPQQAEAAALAWVKHLEGL